MKVRKGSLTLAAKWGVHALRDKKGQGSFLIAEKMGRENSLAQKNGQGTFLATVK